ncbi:macrolide 2'-phosphotransferase [Alkalicoccus halolimnae]|uniref:Macrolide 2'-phosphotransferase n=1 Tax=Alkalicoccus halolimnae TaxID=1667239 RepID=A0A5C7F3T0_9BACI|nr:macrolide 2'-phosphotransferase [Alkalicoccus halolimnae]TXF85282.1 Mph(B) family macrolide 2'-phosphotransferase [Alkalicoccus halolimnae]
MKTIEIKQLAEKNGLHISEETITMNESGVDFLVAYAKDPNKNRWILRIPRRPESMRHAGKEKAALEIIQRHVRFEVPFWSVFSEDLIAYRELSGVPAAVIDMEKQDYEWKLDKTNVPAGYYESLGTALADLHAIPPKAFHPIGAETTSAGNLRSSMKERMARVKEIYDVNETLWERWQRWLADDTIWPAHAGVLHGDLHPGHILIDENSRVTGLIDWTETAVGDVSADFLSHYLIFGKEGLAELLHAYARAGGKTWSGMEEHIEELLTTSGITVAEYAEVSGLKEMHEAAAHMLSQENGR